MLDAGANVLVTDPLMLSLSKHFWDGSYYKAHTPPRLAGLDPVPTVGRTSGPPHTPSIVSPHPDAGPVPTLISLPRPLNSSSPTPIGDPHAYYHNHL